MITGMACDLVITVASAATSFTTPFHHTLLHSDSKQREQAKKNRPSSRSRSSSPVSTPSTSKADFLSALINQNCVTLLPTVLVKIEGKSVKANARCLVDSSSPVSSISRKLVDKLDLTTQTLKDETIFPLTLRSRFESNTKIDATFRVGNRISLEKPAESLPDTYKNNYPHQFFEDPKFYEPAPTDIIIGVDAYTKIITKGVYTRPGLPTAQSMIFGGAIYGCCSTCLLSPLTSIHYHELINSISYMHYRLPSYFVLQ